MTADQVMVFITSRAQVFPKLLEQAKQRELRFLAWLNLYIIGLVSNLSDFNSQKVIFHWSEILISIMKNCWMKMMSMKNAGYKEVQVR